MNPQFWLGMNINCIPFYKYILYIFLLIFYMKIISLDNLKKKFNFGLYQNEHLA